MALIDEKEKPLRMLLRENDFDDLEFRLAPSMLEGSGRWERKPRRFAFGEGLAPDPVIERMRAAWRDGDLYETGGDALFETRAGIGETEINGRIDVAKAETLLERAGTMDLKDLDGPTGIWGDDKAEAILRFQAGNGLKQDAVMQPGGETMGMLKAKLAAKPAAAKSAKRVEASARTGESSDPTKSSPRADGETRKRAPDYRPKRPLGAGGAELPPHPKDPRFNPDGTVSKDWLTGDPKMDAVLEWAMENSGYDEKTGKFGLYRDLPGFQRDLETGRWTKVKNPGPPERMPADPGMKTPSPPPMRPDKKVREGNPGWLNDYHRQIAAWLLVTFGENLNPARRDK